MELSTIAIVSWLAQPAAAALVNIAQQYLVQRLGLGSSPPAASGVKPLLDDYLQKLTARLDEDRIAKLHGAFLNLMDAPRSAAKHGLLVQALDRFHEAARLPKQGMTGGRPNAELQCMAFIGMAASHILLGDRSELIVEKMVEAVSADADTAKHWLGEDLVREILSRFPPPGVICPKCGFQNPAGSRFCNQDGYPLPRRQHPAPSKSQMTPPLSSKPSVKVTKPAGTALLRTIAVILFILWLVGWLVLHVAGLFIHILLLLAVICLILSLSRMGSA